MHDVKDWAEVHRLFCLSGGPRRRSLNDYARPFIGNLGRHHLPVSSARRGKSASSRSGHLIPNRPRCQLGARRVRRQLSVAGTPSGGPMNRVGLLPTTHRGQQDSRHSHDSRQTGLPEMVGSHEGQKVTLNRENGRDRPKQSCYYAAL